MSMRPFRVQVFAGAAVLLVFGAVRATGVPAAGEIPLRVEYVFPEAYQKMAPNARIYVTFSRPVDPATITTSTFFLSPSTPGTVSYDPESRTATFQPDTLLVPTTPIGLPSSYYATVTQGVKAEDGTVLEASYGWSFSVLAASDAVPPEVGTCLPPAVDAALNSGVEVYFSEMVDPSTVNAATFRISPPVAGVLSYVGASRVATFRPSEDLEAGTAYAVTVTSGISDTAGNPLASDFTWQFTTGSARDQVRPAATSFYPTQGSTVTLDVFSNSGVVVTATFSEPMDAASLQGGTILMDGQPVESVTYDPSMQVATIGNASDGTHRIRITTGAKDLAGNALASDVSWSFKVKTTDICGNGACDDIGGGGGGGGCFLNALGSRKR